MHPRRGHAPSGSMVLPLSSGLALLGCFSTASLALGRSGAWSLWRLVALALGSRQHPALTHSPGALALWCCEHRPALGALLGIDYCCQQRRQIFSLGPLTAAWSIAATRCSPARHHTSVWNTRHCTAPALGHLRRSTFSGAPALGVSGTRRSAASAQRFSALGRSDARGVCVCVCLCVYFLRRLSQQPRRPVLSDDQGVLPLNPPDA